MVKYSYMVTSAGPIIDLRSAGGGNHHFSMAINYTQNVPGIKERLEHPL